IGLTSAEIQVTKDTKVDEKTFPKQLKVKDNETEQKAEQKFEQKQKIVKDKTEKDSDKNQTENMVDKKVSQDIKSNINIDAAIQTKALSEKATLGDLLKLTDIKDNRAQTAKKGKKISDEKEEKSDSDKPLIAKHKAEPEAQIGKTDEHATTIMPIVVEKKSEQKKESNEQKQNNGQAFSQVATEASQTDTMNAKMAQTTQTIKYFSEELKEQIDSYKPPLMKLSLNLNPEDIGAVNITMVARGGALSVMMTSNQSALQMFMQNSGQLHQNLTALGFTNLAINFNSDDKKSGDKKSDSNSSKKEDAKKSYLENKDSKSSFLDSIELKIFDSKYL
ncbi:MAG: hypothetical protein RL154_899, partial [Pseudomonadota bacterium]